MKIGIDVRKIDDYGIGAHIRNVILPAALRFNTADFYLFSAGPADVTQASHFHWMAEKSPKYSLVEHFLLARKASELRLDLFHAPHYTLPLRLRCKTIVTIHDLIHLKYPQFFPYWKVKAAEALLRRVLKKADRILTVSRTSRDDIVEFHPPAAEKIEVVYNRLSRDWLEPSPAVDLSTLGLGDRDYLLYVGNFKKHKDLQTLVAAYQRLRSAPMLVLAGRPSEFDSELAEKIFSMPNVRVLGFMDGLMLRRLYAGALLFVFPSLYEGFGYPPLEAMISGVPVLSSDAPALQEVLGGGVEYFPRGNAEALAGKLQILLDDSSLREDLGKRGMEQARKFTSEAPVERLAEIYRSFSS